VSATLRYPVPLRTCPHIHLRAFVAYDSPLCSPGTVESGARARLAHGLPSVAIAPPARSDLRLFCAQSQSTTNSPKHCTGRGRQYLAAIQNRHGVYSHRPLKPPMVLDAASPVPPNSHKLPVESVQDSAPYRAPGTLLLEATPSVP
jgi:hypothetical protein